MNELSFYIPAKYMMRLKTFGIFHFGWVLISNWNNQNSRKWAKNWHWKHIKSQYPVWNNHILGEIGGGENILLNVLHATFSKGLSNTEGQTWKLKMFISWRQVSTGTSDIEADS